MTEDQEIYPPILTPEYRRVLTYLAKSIGEVVRRGWEELVTYAELAEPSPDKDVLAPLHRHVLECLDGVAVLVSEGCTDATKPLLRSAVEAVWGIEYILEADSVRRARAYRVDHLNRLVFAIKSGPSALLATTPASTQELDSVSKQIGRIESLLAAEPLQEINVEWHRRIRGRRLPSWFSLFDGPSSLFKLAKHLGHQDWYETLYSFWSGFSHATDALRSLSVDPNGGGGLLGPRDPTLIQEMASLAMSFGLSATNKTVKRFSPGRSASFVRWYESIKPDYVKVTSVTMIRTKDV